VDFREIFGMSRHWNATINQILKLIEIWILEFFLTFITLRRCNSFMQWQINHYGAY